MVTYEAAGIRKNEIRKTFQTDFDNEKTEKQYLYIQEMEKYIRLLEEENAQQKQMIEYLEEENRVLQKNYKEYVALVHKMMEELQ